MIAIAIDFRSADAPLNCGRVPESIGHHQAAESKPTIDLLQWVRQAQRALAIAHGSGAERVAQIHVLSVGRPQPHAADAEMDYCI